MFGASTARELTRRGWAVSVVEQYTAGNVRSGSGGETRLLRFSHGDADWYTLCARRALELWRDVEAETGVQLFEPVGVAWFETGDDDFTQRSEQALRRLGIACERLTPAESKRLYPSLGVDGLRSTLYEPEAGVLYARLATRTLLRGLSVETARPTPADPPRADVVVWACGSWLPGLFPELVEQRISRRDVFYAGVDGTWAGRPARGAVLWARRARRARIRGRVGRAGCRDRPRHAGAAAGSGGRTARARVPRPALPGARRRAARRLARLPVRPDGRHAFPLRPPSGAHRLVAPRRQLGSRVQARPGPRRVRRRLRRRPARARAVPQPRPARRPRRPAHRDDRDLTEREGSRCQPKATELQQLLHRGATSARATSGGSRLMGADTNAARTQGPRLWKRWQPP